MGRAKRTKCGPSDPRADKRGYRLLTTEEFNVEEWHAKAERLIASWELSNGSNSRPKSRRPGKHNIFYVPGVEATAPLTSGVDGDGGVDGGGGSSGVEVEVEAEVQDVRSSPATPVSQCLGRWSWKSVGDVGEK